SFIELASAAAARANVSSNPSAEAADGITSPCLSARPFRNANRHANRLPLSTVDTYAGCNGRNVDVSYQFRKWPRYCSSLSNVSNVLPSRSTRPGNVTYPRSWADSAERTNNPMLVGDVRCAIAPLGSSWKLSGGSQ